MAADNQFTVDLGTMKLSDDQKARINSAIQKAVAGELTGLGLSERVVLIPANKWKTGLGPIINGIVIRQLDEKIFQQVIR